MKLSRITKSSDYKRILQASDRKKFVCQGFVCIVLIKDPSVRSSADEGFSTENTIRYGYVAAKRSVGNAVSRNRCKRRLRELAALILTQYGNPYAEYVFIARKPLVDMPFQLLEEDMKRCLKKYNLGSA